ncbi:MAG: hypothetical protein MUF15_09455 [Acidobacteria bacterium]|jgi:hypothetical protein|nr:hypothetical protein [Acidobacteriota bacterium]
MKENFKPMAKIGSKKGRGENPSGSVSINNLFSSFLSSPGRIGEPAPLCPVQIVGGSRKPVTNGRAMKAAILVGMEYQKFKRKLIKYAIQL